MSEEIYNKLDSIEINKQHIDFCEKLYEDFQQENMLLDLFAPIFSIEDTIIKVMSIYRDDETKDKIISIINGNIGLDNISFYNKVKEEING